MTSLPVILTIILATKEKKNQVAHSFRTSFSSHHHFSFSWFLCVSSVFSCLLLILCPPIIYPSIICPFFGLRKTMTIMTMTISFLFFYFRRWYLSSMTVDDALHVLLLLHSFRCLYPTLDTCTATVATGRDFHPCRLSRYLFFILLFFQYLKMRQQCSRKSLMRHGWGIWWHTWGFWLKIECFLNDHLLSCLILMETDNRNRSPDSHSHSSDSCNSNVENGVSRWTCPGCSPGRVANIC